MHLVYFETLGLKIFSFLLEVKSFYFSFSLFDLCLRPGDFGGTTGVNRAQTMKINSKFSRKTFSLTFCFDVVPLCIDGLMTVVFWFQIET